MIAAGARRADNRPLVLLPHDCRRVFASEHLNNNVPVHVIQALLGHATLDTIMVYAKLYPTTLIEEYRKAERLTPDRTLVLAHSAVAESELGDWDADGQKEPRKDVIVRAGICQ